MQITRQNRINEIQRLRVHADLLELIGSIEDDDVLTKENIREEIFRIIVDNFLNEASNIY